MRARLFWAIVVGVTLAACAIQRAQIANDARINMIGLSKEQVLACMGPPLNQYAKGTREIWSYNSENKATPAGDGSGHYCTVNVNIWNGHVGAVDYLGPGGGLIPFNEACAFAVQSVPVTIHHKSAADYFMIVTRKGQRRLWQWQIQQRPPTGMRIYGEGFKSELAARLAGAKALRALLTSKE